MSTVPNAPTDVIVAPFGKPYGFTAYQVVDMIDQDTLHGLMTTADLLAEFSSSKPGFFHVEKLGTTAIKCEFLALNKKDINTIYEKGLTTKEVTLAETATIIIMCPQKYVLISGSEGAAKPALYHLSNCLSIVCKIHKPEQHALVTLLDEALKIWSVKYTNIKHTELKEVMFKGALDDRFPMSGDINTCDIAACEVSLETQGHGARNFRVSKEGRVVIKGLAKQPVSLSLVAWTLAKIF